MSLEIPATNPALRLVARFGSKAAAAEHFGVSREAIRLWLKSGIPADRALDIEEATKGTDFEISANEVLQYARQQKAAAAEVVAEQKATA